MIGSVVREAILQNAYILFLDLGVAVEVLPAALNASLPTLCIRRLAILRHLDVGIIAHPWNHLEG